METLVPFFLFAITLHNLEEALWLPDWSKHASKFQKPVEKNEFRFAVICITALAYLSAFYYLVSSDSGFAKFIFAGFLGAMMLNAVFPHLLATLALKSYAPGLLTGILLNIPINGFILHTFIQNQELTYIQLALSTIAVGAVLVMLIPLLFKIGKSVTGSF